MWCNQKLCGHQSSVESVAFNSTNEHVASGGAGGSVKLWDVEKAQGAAMELFVVCWCLFKSHQAY